MDKQIQGFDALVQFDQYRELVEQITAFKNLLSADPVDVAKMEAVQKLIISNVAKIKAADSEEVEEEEDLTTIPTSLQDKAVQDELIKYLSPDIYNLMQSPKFKPLATHIEALFKRLSESEGSYGEEQIDYILTTAALDPQQFLFLILFDAVKSGVDLSTLGLVAASTDAENALFLSLKDISYSAFGDYLADKAKVLISEKQDSELKIALGNRVHAVKREDFTKLMTYARLYYDPSVDLLVSTIMNTENKEIKEKLVTLLPEAERNKIKKIQDFIDEKDVEKSTSLAKDLIQDKSTSSQFLAALPYIAVRDFSQIDKIILAILAEHRNDENSIEKNIGTLFRKVAEKSAGKAQEYLSKLDAIIARAGITYKRDIELTKQAAISAVALAVSYTDIDTAIKIALTSKRKGPLSDLLNHWVAEISFML